MKKLLFALGLLIMVGACKKSSSSLSYKKTINGVWKITSIKYSGNLSIPFVGNSPINGVSKDLNFISFNRETKEELLAIDFKTDSLVLFGTNLGPQQIKLKDSGFFTESETAITLNTDAGGKTVTIDKASQSETSATWTTTAAVSLVISLPIGGQSFPVSTTLKLEMEAIKVH